jgi:hypothetical protein
VLPLLCLSMLALLALAGVLPLYLPEIAAGQSDPLYRSLLGGPADLAALSRGLWPGLALAAALVLAAWWWPARGAALRWAPSTRASAAAVVTTIACAWIVLPWWADRLQGPVKAEAEQARAWLDGVTPGADAAAVTAPTVVPGTAPSNAPTAAPATAPTPRRVVQWRLHQPSFALYLGQPTELRPPRQGELALVRLDRLPPAYPPVASPAVPATAAVGQGNVNGPDKAGTANAAKAANSTVTAETANSGTTADTSVPAAPSPSPAIASARWRLLHQGQGYGLLLWLAAEPASDSP